MVGEAVGESSRARWGCSGGSVGVPRKNFGQIVHICIVIYIYVIFGKVVWFLYVSI